MFSLINILIQGMIFHVHETFSLSNGESGKNVIIFVADMSSSVHVVNKKDILILDKALTQRLDDTRLTAEPECAVNFTKWVKLSYVYTIMKVTVKVSELVAYPVCLENISKIFSNDNMKKTGLNGYMYDFLVDFGIIDVNDLLDIQKYLIN